jgi:5-methylcytosine-specific restriction enzyme A
VSRKRRISLRQNEKEIGNLTGPNGRRLCRWCRHEVSPPRKTFCSENCLHEWRLRSSVKYLRKFVYERDLGICAQCGIDTRYTRIEIENAAQASMRESGRWYWEDHPIYLACIAKYELTLKEARGTLFHADHIIRVVDGGGLADLSNIQSMCIKCHKIKTKEENKRKRRKYLKLS